MPRCMGMREGMLRDEVGLPAPVTQSYIILGTAPHCAPPTGGEAGGRDVTALDVCRCVCGMCIASAQCKIRLGWQRPHHSQTSD